MYATAINSVEVGTSSSEISDGISLKNDTNSFSLYYEITGDGDIDFFYYASVDGENFVKETRAIKRGLTKTSGPDSDGKGILHIPVMPCNAIKIEAENTDASNTATVTALLGYRQGTWGDYLKYDGAAAGIQTIDYAHHEVHGGSHYHLTYSVANIGAMSGPDDTITLTFYTPDTTKWLHMVVSAICSDGALFQIIEGGTGGGSSPTGELTVYNSERNSGNTSGILATSGGNAGKVSYDATLVTGGTTLHSEYIGSGGNKTFAAGTSRAEQEWVLKQNTQYQFAITETGNVTATLVMGWYEHTNR